MTRHRGIRVHLCRALVLAAMLCTANPMFGQEPISVGDMSTPESALHDPGADVYLVSNIDGGPGDLYRGAALESPSYQRDGSRDRVGTCTRRARAAL